MVEDIPSQVVVALLRLAETEPADGQTRSSGRTGASPNRWCRVRRPAEWRSTHIGTGSSSTSAGAAVPRAQLAPTVRRLLMDSALTWTAPNSSDA
ncbi:hypothetical protein [Streptomyces sp. NPDC017988]|uniref:hypothetical protein n=1 Tax=Streptomyces sp. NPDC017988 TaxID=3365025 RepID=UPI0037AC2952